CRPEFFLDPNRAFFYYFMFYYKKLIIFVIRIQLNSIGKHQATSGEYHGEYHAPGWEHETV
ncbi:MAG: hypothetical protein ACLFQY_07920, partial [Desulfococcaceae bacterium]